MKVWISKYPRWFGVWEVADCLRWVGVSEQHREDFAEWLSETKVNDFFQWLYQVRRRRSIVLISRDDTFDAIGNIARVAAPLLTRLKEDKDGSPYVDPEDVPEYLRPSWTPKNKEDHLWHPRWRWVLNELIYATDKLTHDWEWDFYHDIEPGTVIPPGATTYPDWDFYIDTVAYEACRERINRAMQLFGKYYYHLGS